MNIARLIGVLIIIAGICAGIYFGVWWALVGGIIQIVNQVKAVDPNALVIALGVLKIIFSSIIGWFIFWIYTIIGSIFCS